jgi:thiol-disulfide isomerase/thioredoxin
MRTPPLAQQILGVVAAAALVGAVVIPNDEPLDRLVVDSLVQTDGQLVDAPAPTFELEDLDGRPVTLADLRGEVVFLNFWATWCPPCRDEMPSMVALAEAMEDRPFRMVAASQDDSHEDLVAFLLEFGVDPSRVLILRDHDGAVARRYGTELLPETYFIDPDGTIVAKYVSTRDWTEPAFRSILERMITRTWRGG